MNDGGLLRLIEQRLRAGVVDQGTVEHDDTGTPQGSVVSPMLSNIFLHHVVDGWFEEEMKPRLTGRSSIVRFADDIRITCAKEEDARRVLAELKQRLAEYKLTINEQKTKLVRFTKPTAGQDSCGSSTVDFLGFTQYWGRTRTGGWTIKRRTMGARLKRAKKRMWQWIKEHIHAKLPEQHVAISAKLRGHYNYYSVRCNYEQLQALYDFTVRTWLKWLKRRTSKHRLNWEKYKKLLETYPLPAPRIVVSWA